MLSNVIVLLVLLQASLVEPVVDWQDNAVADITRKVIDEQRQLVTASSTTLCVVVTSTVRVECVYENTQVAMGFMEIASVF